MVADVAARKLESLRRCLARLRARRPESLEALQADLDAQDILSLNLSRVVQLCVDLALHELARRGIALPETMGAAFTVMAEHGLLDADLARRLRRAVGFRNLVVHNYREIDWTLVMQVLELHLGDFDDFAAAFIRPC